MKSLIHGMLGVLALVAACTSQASAQTITFAEAYDQLAKACTTDIEKHCSKVSLGGGKVKACLQENSSKISEGCKTTSNTVFAQLAKRASAQANVQKVCDTDIRQYCSKVQPGDGYRIQCLVRSTKVVSKACQQIIVDAGWNQ